MSLPWLFGPRTDTGFQAQDTTPRAIAGLVLNLSRRNHDARTSIPRVAE